MKRRRTVASTSTATTQTTTTTTHNSIYDDFTDDTDENDNIEDKYGVLHVSDRIQRFIQTLEDDIDHDDEIYVSSNGQTISLQDVILKKKNQNPQHDEQQQMNRQLKKIIHHYLPPSKAQRHVDSTPATTTSLIGTRYQVDQIWLYCSIATFTIMIQFLLSLWYYYYCNRTSFTKKPIQSELDSEVVATASKWNEIPVEAINRIPFSDAETKIDNNEAVPHLVKEFCLDSTMNTSDVVTETLLPDNTTCDQLRTIPTVSTTSLLPTNRISSTPDDHAHQVINFVLALQEKCIGHNIEYDKQTLWQWAIQQQTIQQQMKTQEMIHLRHQTYDHIQQTMNRYQQQQHHDATVKILREDKEWLTKLVTARNRCYDTILHSIYQSCMGLCLIVFLRPIISIIHVLYHSNNTTTIMDVLCYKTGTRLDKYIPLKFPSTNPTHQLSTTEPSSSYYEYYNSLFSRYIPTFTYIDSYNTILTMGDVATCATLTLGRIVVVIASILAWYTVSWFLQQLTSGIPRLQFLFQSIIIVYILLIYEWIPTLYLYRIIIVLGVILSICYGAMTYRYYTIRNKFLSMKNSLPQISEVNQEISWFDDIVHHIQLIPIVVVSGLIFMFLTEYRNSVHSK